METKKFLLRFFDIEAKDSHNEKDKTNDGETIMKAGIQKARKAIQILTVSAYFYNLEK